jgi:hypothetical protein
VLRNRGPRNHHTQSLKRKSRIAYT